MFVSERGAVNNYTGSIGINLDCPGKTRTSGHPTNKKRAAETSKGKQPSLVLIWYSVHFRRLAHSGCYLLVWLLHPLLYIESRRILFTLIEGQAN